MTVQSFLGDIWGAAQSTAQKYGLDPNFIAGVAGLESGFGASAPGNNYFGIKGSGDAGVQTQMTSEYINGKMVHIPQSFAAYSSPQAAFDAFGKLISGNSRYASVVGATSLGGEVSALGSSGYASDPSYTQKLAGAVQTVQANSGQDWLAKLTGGMFYANVDGAKQAAGLANMAAGKTVDPNAPSLLETVAYIAVGLLCLGAGIFALSHSNPTAILTKG